MTTRITRQRRLNVGYRRGRHESPLKAGIVGRSFSLPFNHPVLFIPSIGTALAWSASILWPPREIYGFLLGEESGPHWALIVTMGLGILVSTILTAAAVKLASDAARGSDTSLGSLRPALMLAARKFPSLLVAQLGLGIMVGGIVFLPMVAGLPLGVFVTIVLAFYLTVRLFCLQQTIMLDGEDAAGAFRRSLQITKGYALDIFIALLMIGLVMVVLNSLVTLLQATILGSISLYPATMVIEVVALPILVSCQTLIYLHLKQPIPEPKPGPTQPGTPAQEGEKRPFGCDMEVECIACPHYTIKGGKDHCLRYGKNLPDNET